MVYYDSHTHLNQETLFPQRETHLANFIARGGRGLVNAGADDEYNQRGLEIAEKSQILFPDCWVRCTLGYHPCDVEQIALPVYEAIDNLKNLIKNHQKAVVAIGECGIDLHYDTEGVSLELQKAFFLAQCELARTLHLPIVIHSRDAFQETIDLLKEYADLKIYFHCRGYHREELQSLLRLFPRIFVGFCGNISYPKAENLRSSLQEVPLERLLIETDAPYLAPQNFRGQTNSPEKVEAIGSIIAELLGKDEESLWRQVEQNFRSLYG